MTSSTAIIPPRVSEDSSHPKEESTATTVPETTTTITTAAAAMVGGTSTDDIRCKDPTMREKLRSRLQDSRTAAAAQLQEFRDHPAQSAAEGAKSVSGMFRKYGPIFVGTYGCVYFTTLGLLFSGVQSGILDPLVLLGWLGQNPSEHGAETATTVHLVVDWMEHHTVTKPYASYVEQNPAFANFAVAWIAVKFTEPIRLAVALTLTPRVSRFLGYTKDPVTPPADDVDTATTGTTTTTTVNTAEEIKKSQ
jgi:hypothetical protein